jgi:hypothetical protein
LRFTHDAASSFLDIFESTRQQRKAKGAATDKEQDLLRAMLTFSSSGLDSMAKHLIKEALGDVIEKREGALKNFKVFIEKRLSKKEHQDNKFLAEVLASRDPRDVLVEELIDELVSQSLQSKEALLRAASYFDIASHVLCEDMVLLQKIFEARNQMAHEMDMEFGQQNRSRKQRRKEDMIDFTEELLRIAKVFLAEVDSILSAPLVSPK